MTFERPELTLYPGEAIEDVADFWAARIRFEAPSEATGVPERWQHGDMVKYLLARQSIRSAVAENIGKAEGTTDFSNEFDFAKRDATIHLPGSDYAIPDWAAQFETVVRQIVEFEHVTNGRAASSKAVQGVASQYPSSYGHG